MKDTTTTKPEATAPKAPLANRQFDDARMLQGAESATQILMACKHTPELLLAGMHYGEDDSTEHGYITARGELERRLTAALDKKSSPDYREGFLRTLIVYLTQSAQGSVPTIEGAFAGHALDEYAAALTGTPLPAEPPTPDFAEDRAAANNDDPEPDRKVLLQPFDWYDHTKLRHSMVDGETSARFAARVFDVTRGTQTAIEVLEQDDLDGEFEDDDGKTLPRMLSENDSAALRRLCLVSLNMLSENAMKHIDWVTKRVEAQANGGGAA